MPVLKRWRRLSLIRTVIADQKRYVRLTKEYHDLEKILKAALRYRVLLSGIEEAKSVLAEETDEELRAFAREELDSAEAEVPNLENEIKLLLVPADPEDAKNACVEIRGGTGGDEAALFAYDLFKMYQKFAEKRGWQLAVTSLQ